MLVMYDSPEAMACFYGAIKIGAVPVPVNYMYTSDDFRYLLNDSRARTVITHEDFAEEIDGWREELHFLKIPSSSAIKQNPIKLAFTIWLTVVLPTPSRQYNL